MRREPSSISSAQSASASGGGEGSEYSRDLRDRLKQMRRTLQYKRAKSGLDSSEVPWELEIDSRMPHAFGSYTVRKTRCPQNLEII